MDYSIIPVVLLFAITMTACFAGGFSKAYYSKRITSSPKDYNLLNGVVSILSAFILFALGRFDTAISVYTVIAGVCFGVITMLNSVLTSVAVNLGPLSYTYVIICSSTIVTALSGYLFWGEELTVLKICGIILMFVCCVLANQSKTDDKKANLKWLIVCIITAFTSAGVGLMQKTHQSSAYREELNMFLVTAFTVSSIISFFLYAVSSHKSGKFGIECKGKLGKSRLVLLLWTIFIVSAIGVSLNNGINLYLSGVVDSAVFFPIVNGGIIMFNILASVLFFKEKLTAAQWTGLAFGIAAIGCLCI